MVERLRLGAVGAGAHSSENLLPAIRLSPDFDLVGICTRNPQTARAAAERWRTDLFTTSLDELCDASDALLVSGPPDLHEALIATALRSRLPLFVEKPPAADAARLTLAAAVPGVAVDEVPVVVDYNMRFTSAWQAAVCALGPDRARLVRVRMVARKPREPMWGERSMLRSLLLSLGVHAIDMAVSSVGADRLVAATVSSIGSDRLSVNATLRSDDGASAELIIGNYANSFESVIEFVGESTRVRIENLTRVTSWPVSPARLGSKAEERVEVGGLAGGFDRSGYGPALAHFAAAARGEVTSVSGLAHSIRVLSIVDELCRAERQDDQ